MTKNAELLKPQFFAQPSINDGIREDFEFHEFSRKWRPVQVKYSIGVFLNLNI